MAQPAQISADEIALYDRQIRLWGVDAQNQIRNANILLVNLRGLGNEVAKNLVLAGIGSLTIADSNPVTADDLAAQFSVSEEDIGKPRAEAALPAIQRLNERVNIFIEPRELLQLGPDYFNAFDVIIATDLSIVEMDNLNAAARVTKRRFYAAGCHGLYGFIFADLIVHEYVITRENSNVAGNDVSQPGTQETPTRTILSSTTQTVDGMKQEHIKKREIYQPLILANTSPLPAEYAASRRRLRQVTPLLPCLRALWDFEKKTGRLVGHSADELRLFTKLATEKTAELQLPVETLKSEFLRSFVQNLGAELSPVCTFLGAHLAQDVIIVLGQKGQPMQNMLLYDGDATAAPIYALTPMVTTMDASLL